MAVSRPRPRLIREGFLRCPGRKRHRNLAILRWPTRRVTAKLHRRECLLSDHVLHLFVHGILHLLGYDHIDDQDAMIMERIEVEILSALGVVNPYIDRGGMPSILER